MASITISCDGTEQKYALETASVTLGRGLESDIRLKDIKASRRHCQIVKAAGGFQLLDLSSGNGTFINGVQVKQQALNAGDKIQIGSTTITFNAAEAAPVKAAVKAPVSQSKVATAQLPVATAATKKITARVEAVKPTTQAVAKAQTQAVRKPGTQSIPKGGGGDKTGTGAFKKTTQKVGGTSRAMGKASATQKFQQEARKGKSNPVAAILIGIGVVFVIVLGFVLFRGGGSNEAQAQHEKYLQMKDRAAALESDQKFDEAIKAYKEALKMAEGYERYKTDIMSMKASIKAIEESKKLVAEAGNRFAAFEKKFDAMKTEEARDLWKEGKDLAAAVEGATFDWKPRLKVILEKIEKVLDTEQATAKRQDFQVIRNEIDTKYKLAGAQPDYAGALKEWKDYLTKPAADKTKTDQAVQSINLKAKGEFRTIKNRAERNAEKDKPAALAEAEKHVARFELTDVAEDFKKLLEELKK
jgi:pSer/pThr/pTyr-binding forkhead associated (FHA) protein